jgi:hypothetical protein
MSWRSKRKKKKRKQKAVLKVPHQPSQQPIPIVAKSQAKFWTILGVLIGAVSLIALIELAPRLSATANSPTDSDDQLSSSKFTVSNDGYLKVTEVMSACFLWKVDLGPSGKPNAYFTSSMARIAQPPESKLAPLEGFTVPCTGNKLVGVSAPYVQPVLNRADLAIVVYYRAWPFTFYRDHRLFRFVAKMGKRNEVVWEKQPAAILEPDFDGFIKTHGGTFPPQSPSLNRPN